MGAGEVAAQPPRSLLTPFPRWVISLVPDSRRDPQLLPPTSPGSPRPSPSPPAPVPQAVPDCPMVSPVVSPAQAPCRPQGSENTELSLEEEEPLTLVFTLQAMTHCQVSMSTFSLRKYNGKLIYQSPSHIMTANTATRNSFYLYV